MEDYELFLETVKSLVEVELGEEYWVYRNHVMKNNNVSLKGLVICRKDEQICPAIYLEEYFEEFKQGKEMQEIVFDVLMRYQKAKELPWKNLDFSFEAVQSEIIYRLVNRERNRELLETCPMVPFLDLAVTFHIMIDGAPQGEQAAVRITNEMMKSWEAVADDLMELAQKNTKELLPARILSMKELLGQMPDETENKAENEVKNETENEAENEAENEVENEAENEAENETENKAKNEAGNETEEEPACENLYILTNQYKIHGASAVLYQGVVRNFAEKIEKDLYLLPSSIHEFILLPKEDGMKKEALEEMVRSVNDTQLPKEEFLSNYVYYYDRKKDKLTKL